MSETERTAGRATGLGRRPFFALVLVLTLAGLLSDAAPAEGQEEPLSDAVPTAWHEAASLTPLLTAPPPPNPATICVIDTGVTPTPDLNITARWAYDGGTLDDVRATEDSPGHGTLVAHFAAGAVNGWGGAGAFPHGRISSVRVFPREGGASWQDYIRAITRCHKLDPNTKVIVISIGGQTIEPGEADELEAHVEQARNLYDVNVVAAAGNGGAGIDLPARFPAAFAVSGLTTDGTLCPFAARGVEVDLLTSGCDLIQAGWDGGWWSENGTSFSAAIVAGSLAAVRSYVPDLGAFEAEQLLLNAATSPHPAVLDLGQALRGIGLAFSPGPPSAPDGRAGPGTTAPASGEIPRPAPRDGGIRRPQLRIRRRGYGVVLSASNRPRSARLECRVAGRRHLSRTDRLRLPRPRRRSLSCRYVTSGASSGWTRVRVPRQKHSR